MRSKCRRVLDRVDDVDPAVDLQGVRGARRGLVDHPRDPERVLVDLRQPHVRHPAILSSRALSAPCAPRRGAAPPRRGGGRARGRRPTRARPASRPAARPRAAPGRGTGCAARRRAGGRGRRTRPRPRGGRRCGAAPAPTRRRRRGTRRRSRRGPTTRRPPPARPGDRPRKSSTWPARPSSSITRRTSASAAAGAIHTPAATVPSPSHGEPGAQLVAQRAAGLRDREHDEQPRVGARGRAAEDARVAGLEDRHAARASGGSRRRRPRRSEAITPRRLSRDTAERTACSSRSRSPISATRSATAIQPPSRRRNAPKNVIRSDRGTARSIAFA